MADTYLSSVFVFTVVYAKIVAIFIMNLYPRATFTPNFGESHNTLINITISLWLISLVFGIKSALIALQLQEWERAYIDTPNVPSRLHHRVLIPLRLFLGVDVYNMPNIAQFISALHISIHRCRCGCCLRNFFPALNHSLSVLYSFLLKKFLSFYHQVSWPRSVADLTGNLIRVPIFCGARWGLF
ncbi:hypothetical protein BJV77DRAFT_1018006 [Russula vinacea]|nr:hypothetical protein BJV77DRAFT_1018006 [Russula vinacea]